MIEYTPELVGFDSALEAIVPIHNLIGVMRKHGAYYSSIKKPYYNETGASKFFDHMFRHKDFVSGDSESEVVIKDRLNREGILTPHLGGWKYTQKSDFLIERYSEKIADPAELDAFGTTMSFLRPALDSELSSIIPYIHQEGESIMNNSWFNLNHWMMDIAAPKGKHTLRWELINGDSYNKVAQDSWGNDIVLETEFQGNSYQDMELATEIQAMPTGEAGYLGDGVFTYDPEQKYSRVRLVLYYSKFLKKNYSINLV